MVLVVVWLKIRENDISLNVVVSELVVVVWLKIRENDIYADYSQ